MPELAGLRLPFAEQRQSFGVAAQLEHRLDLIREMDRDRGRETGRPPGLVVGVESLERPRRISSPVVEDAEQGEVGAAGRHPSPRLGVGEASLGELARERLVALQRGDVGERRVHGRLVQVAACVLGHQFLRAFGMFPRKRQPSGPLLDEREVPEDVRLGRLVPPGDRAEVGLEDEPRLADSPGPDQTMAPRADRLVDRSDVAGPPGDLDRALGERERLRLALVETDDRERGQCARQQRLLAHSLGKPERLAGVLLGDRQALGDPRAERELDLKLQLDFRREVGLEQGLAKAFDSRAHVDQGLDLTEQRQCRGTVGSALRVLEQLVREHHGTLRRSCRQVSRRAHG